MPREWTLENTTTCSPKIASQVAKWCITSSQCHNRLPIITSQVAKWYITSGEQSRVANLASRVAPSQLKKPRVMQDLPRVIVHHEWCIILATSDVIIGSLLWHWLRVMHHFSHEWCNFGGACCGIFQGPLSRSAVLTLLYSWLHCKKSDIFLVPTELAWWLHG